MSRKGVFIPDITIEMFKKATLESVEEFMASGQMEDIEIPDIPHGEWIWNTYNYYAQRRYCKCSICGVGMGDTEYDFCPNCGADMRKESETE